MLRAAWRLCVEVFSAGCRCRAGLADDFEHKGGLYAEILKQLIRRFELFAVRVAGGVNCLAGCFVGQLNRKGEPVVEDDLAVKELEGSGYGEAEVVENEFGDPDGDRLEALSYFRGFSREGAHRAQRRCGFGFDRETRENTRNRSISLIATNDKKQRIGGLFSGKQDGLDEIQFMTHGHPACSK